jgi:DNA-binding GntR family transcriptional regulator
MPKILAPQEETLGRRAYRALREQIVDGRLQPGQRLSLRSVAQVLGMSMAPVGEAFRELARDGLIESETGWGSRVRKLDLETLTNQHILRTALECEAIRHCTERATLPQIAELEAIALELDRLVENHGPPAEVCELDSRVHLRIAELSGAASLVELLQANQLIRLLGRGSRIARDVPRPSRDHGRLVDAIRSRNPDEAEREMRGHCTRSMQLQLARFTAHGSTSLAERGPESAGISSGE